MLPRRKSHALSLTSAFDRQQTLRDARSHKFQLHIHRLKWPQPHGSLGYWPRRRYLSQNARHLYVEATSLAYASTVRLYSIMPSVRLLKGTGMTPQCAARTDYTAVPFDFPYELDDTSWNRCVTWNICEELALHLASECAQVQLESDRSVRPIDILLKSYRLVESLGWGEPSLLRWVIQRVAVLLEWPMPDIARQR